MNQKDDLQDQRRQFLNWMAASPLFALGLGTCITGRIELNRNH